MNKVIYTYHSTNTTIQCQHDEKLKNINERLKQKLCIQNANIYYLFNGSKINEELTYDEISNGKNTINIIINDIEEQEMKQYIKSKEIICPKCNEMSILNFKNYQFDMECKNGHNIKNILIKEFSNKGNIIKCFKCGKNRLDTYKNEFFYCLECDNSLCPLCKSSHKHTTINYDNKYYKCHKHKYMFVDYCENCKLNLCMLCSKEHKEHKINLQFSQDRKSVV